MAYFFWHSKQINGHECGRVYQSCFSLFLILLRRQIVITFIVGCIYQIKAGAIMTTAECQKLGSCPLFQQGKITQNQNPKHQEKIKSINMVRQKVVIGVSRHAEFKSGLCFGLALLLHKVLATFQSKHMTILPVFCTTPSFWLKLDSQIFRIIRP